MVKLTIVVCSICKSKQLLILNVLFYTIDKSIDGALGIRTRGSSMEGAEEPT